MKSSLKSNQKSFRTFILLFAIVVFCLPSSVLAQSNDDCYMCHEDKDLKGTRRGKTYSAFVNNTIFQKSIHGSLNCIDCHSDVDPADLPHQDDLKPADCSSCHKDETDLYKQCLHGKAKSKGDKLAPTCETCHGSHNILSSSNSNSPIYPSNVPFLCGKCHKEGSPVQLQRNIPQDRILENYSESIHGEGLLRKGLIVSATCVSCHSAHRILPHTDSRSTISRSNIAATCSKCHANIESVHQKVIKGELWEKEAHILPACVDCHQPHQIRKVFYDQGFANQECLKCHSNETLISSKDGHSLFVDVKKLEASMHQKVNCSQCHIINNPFKHRPCENIMQEVDCDNCHSAVGNDYTQSMHGKLKAASDPNAPTCKECHGTHKVLGKLNPKSPIFATNIPTLCGNCHREGEQAAIRIVEGEDVVGHYTESIHGKGLLKSGLTVTANCTDCHTSHRELPANDPLSSVNQANIAKTCGSCHHGIEDKFETSIHSPLINKTDKRLPVCSTCHSAHSITRADAEGFKLTIMTQCGQCHEKITETYFDTYHGKVSQLGYTKTAKCYDCHGSHDIKAMNDPGSRLSRENIVETCKACHPSANRQFAGYFTHATHHDPDKYPVLFWTFWGMTGLLVGTFVLAGLHTILWLPRSLQWRRELKRRKTEENNNG